MLKNYLKIAFRNLFRNKAHSVINITGLSVGMAIALLIGLWVWDELTFNRNFKNYDRIARVYQNQDFNGEISSWFSMPSIMAEAIRTGYGDNFKYVLMSSWTQSRLLAAGETRVTKSGNFIEPQGPDMLSLKMLQGTRAGLKDPHSILLSASLAKALFGNANPMDQLIKIDGQMDVKVTGVYEDLPYNSSFADVAYLAPWDLLIANASWLKELENPWNSNSFQTFVQVADNVDIEKASARIRNVKKDNVRNTQYLMRFNPEVYLHPMRKWRLYNDFDNGVNTGGRIQFVWLFAIIGVFVLLLACINFMNLSTARSEKRAKEVGIRKAIGSFRTQLVSQFFCESVLLAVIAFMLCILLAQLALPAFNVVADKKISIPWTSSLFWLTGIGFSGITGLLAGSYPALYLSSFRPVKVLKGTFRAGRYAAMPRKVLVVLQFSVSVILIIGTLTVFRQIQYARDRPKGYNNDRLLMLTLIVSDIYDHYETVKQELKNTGAVVEMAISSSPLTSVWDTNGGFDWEGKNPDMAVDIPNTGVSHDYGKTVGWEFVAGRDFSPTLASDTMTFVINESAAKFMGFKNPVGAIIKWGDVPMKVIGVIRDMIMESPYQSVRPSVYTMAKRHQNVLIMKLNPAMGTQRALNIMEAVFKKYSSVQPFNYQFADQDYARKFEGETRIGKLAGIFAILAIFISCLGLFGMSAFMAEQRTKEIGVRKVLGASVFNVWQLLSKEFVILVAVAFVIAAPLAYWFMQKWLQNYEYRSDIPWWIFILTAMGAMLITLLTISGQSIKAALMNPVKSLRSE